MVDQGELALKQRAHANLTELHHRVAACDAEPAEIREDAAGDASPLACFVMPDARCAGCGVVDTERQTHCRACDPRTA